MQIDLSKYASALSTALLVSVLAGCSDEPEAVATEAPAVKVNTKPNFMPPLNLDILPQTKSSASASIILSMVQRVCVAILMQS
ncbi:hypothetical protein JCM18903_2923 [Psychrobacter sp. JCM 18903]|uniref:hypothetical protein n=1 Tax=Psychrobacter sp. JCM 18903 TaxID=1298610 RepID=UPI000436C892|nr:hypothetical protein [Psychrobacter sp. JCM 18903]GAF62818.1 hypothetical protein JCM18903_2923 [Psychrobacter sp. JCM 18903]